LSIEPLNSKFTAGDSAGKKKFQKRKELEDKKAREVKSNEPEPQRLAERGNFHGNMRKTKRRRKKLGWGGKKQE